MVVYQEPPKGDQIVDRSMSKVSCCQTFPVLWKCGNLVKGKRTATSGLKFGLANVFTQDYGHWNGWNDENWGVLFGTMFFFFLVVVGLFLCGAWGFCAFNQGVNKWKTWKKCMPGWCPFLGWLSDPFKGKVTDPTIGDKSGHELNHIVEKISN